MTIRDIEPDDVNGYLKELGSRLRSIREAQGYTIEEITESTKIQTKYLAAIEEGDLERLPKGPYARGFVRQYCEYLSAPDLWRHYSDVIERRPVANPVPLSDENQDYTAPQTVFRHVSYWWVYLLIAIPIAVAAWITWGYRGEITGVATDPMGGGTAPISASRDASADLSAGSANALSRPETESQDAVEEEPTAPASAEPGEVDLSWMDGKPQQKPKEAKPQKPQAAKPAVRALEIKATGKVWLKVTEDNKSLYEGIMQAGDAHTFKPSGTGKLKVRYGNPQSAIATWKGKTQNPVGSGSKPVTLYYE